MLILLGVLLDGAATVALGLLIGEEWKWSLPFWLGLTVVHGVIAGFVITIMLAVRALENATEIPTEALEVERGRPEFRAPAIFGQPALDKAA
jgi:predicted MFS family arabinose efflux permease